jgi:ParB family chromosome partitioning protein
MPMDMARALSRLKTLKGGCSSKVLVEEYGFSGAAISKAEALLSLPADIQEQIGSGPGQIAPATGYEISRLPDEQSMRELAQAVVTRHLPRQAVVEAVQARVGKRNVASKGGRLSCKHAGISITVCSGQPLTRAGVMQAIDHLKKQAQKLTDEATKEVATASHQTA